MSSEWKAVTGPLVVVFDDLDGLLGERGSEPVARMRGATLYVDRSASVDDQVRVTAEAVAYRLTGDPGSGRRPRHLHVVPEVTA